MSWTPSHNWDDDNNRLFGLAIAFLVLDVLFLCLRFTSRRIGGIKEGWDGVFLYPALMVNIAMSALTLRFVYGGGAYHPNFSRIGDKITTLSISFFAFQVMSTLAVGLPKLSFLALYLRIFTIRYQRVAIRFAAAMLAGHVFAMFVSTLLMCQPISAIWDPWHSAGDCLNITTLVVYCCVSNIVIDALLVLLPVPMIWNLRMQRDQKFRIYFMFVLGTLGIIPAGVRWRLYYNLYWTDLPPRGSELSFNVEPIIDHNMFINLDWDVSAIFNSTNAEASVYMISACLPTLQPLLRACLPTLQPLFRAVRSSLRSGKSDPISELRTGIWADGQANKSSRTPKGYRQLIHESSRNRRIEELLQTPRRPQQAALGRRHNTAINRSDTIVQWLQHQERAIKRDGEDIELGHDTP